MPEYIIYRKPDGKLDCIPRESRLYEKAKDSIVEVVHDTCVVAWSHLRRMEKDEARSNDEKIFDMSGSSRTTYRKRNRKS